MTDATLERLNARTMAHAHTGTLPDYDRTGAPVIAHLGFGAFARAHLAVYADDLLRRGHPALISGVALRSERAQEALEPQNGLFTVAVREPGDDLSLHVVGSLASMRTGPVAALEVLMAPATRLVTLTITEKGYAATDEPAPAGAPGAASLIALALAHWRQAGLAPPVFASLDNLLDNGRILRERVLDAAETLESSLAAWIASEVRFPSSVVDRMVPAPTPRDREEVADRLGLRDDAAVATERHRSWVMRSEDGLEHLDEVGVELVDDVAPYERRKLWLLNGPHSAAAYGGLLAGCRTIAESVTHPTVAPFVRDLGRQTLEAAEFPAALQPDAFAGDALRRFANPALGHLCTQVGADGSSKLPQRLLPVVAARRARSLDTTRFATVAAIWLAATAGLPVRGVLLPRLEDPMAQDLSAAARHGGPAELSHRALGDTVFAKEVAGMLERVATRGLSVLEAEQ
jgi:fructuronate reductase